jgi:hypothetical protein
VLTYFRSLFVIKMLSFRCVTVAFATFGSLLLPPQVTGMAHLTPEMVTARNLEEYLEAEAKIKASPQEIQNHRLRQMQEEGLEDSKIILADMYDGKPGFYHGVASGKCIHEFFKISELCRLSYFSNKLWWPLEHFFILVFQAIHFRMLLWCGRGTRP